MTIGGSLFLIAVGAIFKFAVTATVAIVGCVGLVLGLILTFARDRP